MRVIAGTARSLPLKTIEGLETRPTTDRIKETLFNMLTGYVPQAKFLDLFAGSGGIGIEALSRGAESCTFVEQAKNAAACIEDNLKFTKLADKAQVRKFDAVSFVSSLPEIASNLFAYPAVPAAAPFLVHPSQPYDCACTR